ncbi:hypothetical protein MXB_4054, partial [Myxobolus squamalis]
MSCVQTLQDVQFPFILNEDFSKTANESCQFFSIFYFFLKKKKVYNRILVGIVEKLKKDDQNFHLSMVMINLEYASY